MRKRVFNILLLLFLETLGVYGLARAGPDDVVAVVGDDKITLKEFKQTLSRLEKTKGLLTTQEKKQLLDNMVTELILYKRAIKIGLDRDPEVQRAIENAKKRILIKILVQREVTKKIHYTEKDLIAYYKKNKDHYIIPALVSGELLFIYKYDKAGKPAEAEAKNIAYKIKQRVKEGESLRQLHKVYTKKTNLIIQPSTLVNATKYSFSRKKALAQLAFSLNPGDVDVAELDDSFVVIRITEKKPAILQPFKEVKNKVEVEFQRDKWTAMFKEYMEGLKKGLNIQINYKSLSQ